MNQFFIATYLSTTLHSVLFISISELLVVHSFIYTDLQIVFSIFIYLTTAGKSTTVYNCGFSNFLLVTK